MATDSSSEIEKKKKQMLSSLGTTTPNNPVGYATTLFRQLFTFGIMIVIGTTMVYSGKVAQANILPTKIKCFPYTNLTPTIDKVDIDINIVKVKPGEVYSTKLDFDQAKNMKIMEEGFLGFLKRMTENKDSGHFYLYACSLYQSAISNNLYMNTAYYNLINSYCSESLILFLLPYFSIFWFIITFAVNLGYITGMWFYNLYLFYSTKTVVNDKTVWQPGESMWSFSNVFKSLFMIFIAFIAWLCVGIGIIVPFMTFTTAVYSILMPMFMEANVKGSGKPYTFSSALLDVFKYKISVIMYIVTYYMITGAYSNFGSTATGVSFIAFIILFFFTNIYKAYKPAAKDTATFGWGNYKQANKECK
jgi:hypothetical protein